MNMDTNWFEELTFTQRHNKISKIREKVEDILTSDNKIIDFYDRESLRISNVEYINGEKGENYYRVWIAGPGPDAYHLQDFILEQLNKLGLPDVLVSTEW